MKKLIAVITFACVSLTPSAFAQTTKVGVSIQVGQPGFFGRLDIGDIQQPQLIYREPRIIQTRYRNRQPLYLVVPYGHSKNWKKYCSRYDACGHPVYFVKEQWYKDSYAPQYREKHDKHDDDDHDNNGHKKNKKHKNKDH